MKIHSSLAVIFLAGTTVSIYAQTNDRRFLQETARIDMNMIELGQLAQQNGSNAGVKQFGERMVADHSKLNDEAKEIAKKENISLPTAESQSERSAYKTLSAKTGNDFDKAYIGDMIRDHEMGLQAFETEAKSGTNPEIKEFAAKAVPIVRAHLTLAESVAKQLGISTKPTAGD